jgi:nucleotide-binding universal stress UspA family protein
MAGSDEKDRLGDALANLEKVREDPWAAAERDRELLAKLRQTAEARAAAERPPSQNAKVFARILCPLDFEEGSLRAVALATRAAQNKAELYLLHVCPAVIIPLGGSVTEPLMAEQSARQRLEELATRELSGIHHELLVTTGNAAERVISVQTGLGADLIVMGTHGRGGLRRLILGSVPNEL